MVGRERSVTQTLSILCLESHILTDLTVGGQNRKRESAGDENAQVDDTASEALGPGLKILEVIGC